MAKAYITDYFKNQDIERSILGDCLQNKLSHDIKVLLVWHEIIDRNFIDQLPNLKGIIRYGVGYESIDLGYAKSKNIYVCNTPDYGTSEVSDTALSMVLNIARGVTRYDYVAQKIPKNWQENTIQQLRRSSEITLGVIGAGRIGSSLIKKALAVGFKIVFYDPYLSSSKIDELEKMGAKSINSKKELLQISDIISINCPQNEETKGMVNKNFLAMMKRGASLVNTARGGLIKDLSLIGDALISNRLSCVGLDVLPSEPPNAEEFINKWKKGSFEGRVIINPHTAYYSKEAQLDMRLKTAKNALRVIKNQKPKNIVNGLE